MGKRLIEGEGPGSEKSESVNWHELYGKKGANVLEIDEGAAKDAWERRNEILEDCDNGTEWAIQDPEEYDAVKTLLRAIRDTIQMQVAVRCREGDGFIKTANSALQKLLEWEHEEGRSQMTVHHWECIARDMVELGLIDETLRGIFVAQTKKRFLPEACIAKIWLETTNEVSSPVAIRLAWSNDRHYRMEVKSPYNWEQVSDALLNLAVTVRADAKELGNGQ